MTWFELLKADLPDIRKLAQSSGANGFFAQEAMRFYSFADRFWQPAFRSTNNQLWMSGI